MLDIGRAISRRSREESGILFCDERGKLRRDAIGKSLGRALFIGFGRAALGLRLPRRRREDPFGIIHAQNVLAAKIRGNKDNGLLLLTVGPRLLNRAGLR